MRPQPQAQPQLQLELESDANHRALRRCHRCGSYARPYDDVNGAIRCEPCAKRDQKKRRDGHLEGESETPDPNVVSFIV